MKSRPCQLRFHFRRDLNSCLQEVDGVCRELRLKLKAFGLESASFRVELVTRECLNNAVLHGNRGHHGKRVRVEIDGTQECIRLKITDEGAGFNWRAARMIQNPPAVESFGRGLVLMGIYADRVQFNSRGNQITLWLSTRKPSEQKKLV